MKNNIKIKVALEEVYPPSTIEIETNGEFTEYTLDKMTHNKKTNLQFMLLNYQRLEKEQKKATKEEDLEKLEQITEQLTDLTYKFLATSLSPIPREFFERIPDPNIITDFFNYGVCYFVYSTLDKFDEYMEEIQKKTRLKK